jgi:hypothetical protein
MFEHLSAALFAIGVGQLGVLVASTLVPIRLKWREELLVLPRLHRQMYWVYGGYTVMGIIALGLICLVCHADLASGSPLARCVCVYGMVFWGVRLSLQAFLEAKPHLATWWLWLGYHTLTVLFTCFAVVYALAVFRPSN